MNDTGSGSTGQSGAAASRAGLNAGPLRRTRDALPMDALAGMGIKVTNAIASFAVSVIIARTAGAEVVGYYALAVAAATLAGIVALRGLDAIALREIAGDLRQKREGRARFVLGALSRQVWLSSVIISGLCLVLLLGLPVAQWLNANRGALFAGAIGVMVVAAFRMTIAVARGTGKPFLGNLTEALPSYLLVAGVGILALAGLGAAVPAAVYVTLFFLSQFASVSFVQARLRPVIQTWPPAEPTDLAPLKRAGIPIMATGTLHMFGDTFILALVGVMLGAEDAGAYRIAFQIVTAISIFTVYTESYVSAKIAADFRAGDIRRMWERHRRASLFVTLLAMPILILTIGFPEWLLDMAFGPEFVRAAPVVRVLALAQVIAVVAGPVGRVLLMCGRQDANFVIAIAAIAILVGLSLVLVPIYGIEGAAYAAAASTVTRALGCTIYARIFLNPGRMA